MVTVLHGRGRTEVSMNPIGELLVADELFYHQSVDTFATVATRDQAWTEKVCAMAMPR